MFFKEDENPTKQQDMARELVMGMYNAINCFLGTGHGAGKTWFWSRVVRWLKEQDPHTT